MYIYKTTNLETGEFYVGKTTKTLDETKNYLGSGVRLKRAMDKYGRDNFSKEVIEECSNSEELNEREKFWIMKLEAKAKGYNLSDGGDGGAQFLGKRHTEETKEKLRKIAIKRKKRHHTEESKKKMSENGMGEKNSMYGKSGLASPRFGKKHSEESKRKISEGLKKWYRGNKRSRIQ